jgi:phosphocarrier protein
MSKVVKKLEIKNKLGLHARAAALLVQTVNKFSAQVSISKDGQTADGRSIMGVLTRPGLKAVKFKSKRAGKTPKRRSKQSKSCRQPF